MAAATRRPNPTRTSPRKAGRGSGAAPSEHQLKQRRHILSHAARLFAEMGYATTTMDMLSAVTEMNKASVYYYFESKREILFVLLRDATVEAVEMALPATRMKTARDGITYLAQGGIRHLYTYKDVTKIFTQELPYISQILSEEQTAEIFASQRRYMKCVYEVLNQGVASGEFKIDNVRLAGSLFVSWTTAPLRFVDTVSQEDVARTVANLFLNGACGHETETADNR